MHDPIPIGVTGSHRFPGYYPFAATQTAPWIAVSPAPKVELDPSRARGLRPEIQAPNPRIARDPSGPAVFAAIAYPNVKGLSLGPALAFEVQRLTQQDDPPLRDRGAAARAYGASTSHLTGFLGLLEPLDVRI